MTLTFLFASLYNIFSPNSLFFILYFQFLLFLSYFILPHCFRSQKQFGYWKLPALQERILKPVIFEIPCEVGSQWGVKSALLLFVSCRICKPALFQRASAKKSWGQEPLMRNSTIFVNLYNITSCCVFNKVIHKMQVFLQALHHDNDCVHI